MLLLSRELPQDETARRISSLPHILILSWARTTLTAATSSTIRDSKLLAADMVWRVAAARLVGGRRKVRFWRVESKTAVRWLMRWTWGGLYSERVLPVEGVSDKLRPQILLKMYSALAKERHVLIWSERLMQSLLSSQGWNSHWDKKPGLMTPTARH